MRASHADWLRRQRADALVIARGIRSGSVGVVEGSRRLAALQSAVEPGAHEELLSAFIAIDSQTDHLPIGDQLTLWAPDALVAKRAELTEAERVHRRDALKACD